eukprot:1600897-Amphidinium_carterae.1
MPRKAKRVHNPHTHAHIASNALILCSASTTLYHIQMSATLLSTRERGRAFMLHASCFMLVVQ